MTKQRIGSLLLVVSLVAIGCTGPPEVESPDEDWPMYRHDFSGTGSSSLSEITFDNVQQLYRAWEYDLARAADDDSPGPNSQATPIVVGGVMYVPAADRVVALDPTNGEEIWRHHVDEGDPSRRGVAYWAGKAEVSPRIIFTSGRRLLALDAATGSPASEFGTSGEVDMVVPYNSVPLVYENIVVVGANTPQGTIGGIGNARAFDAGSGDKVWEFSSVPQPGSVGHDTWEADSWRDRLGANAWPFYFTTDEERGLLYLPLASPIPGAYGGDRLGANLYGNSVVAVDIRTGTYVWHFQTIHHDLWDADPPAPPVLFDIEGEPDAVPALGLTTKSGYLYILNRETGEPIYDVEERPVPESDVPGESVFSTQPFPLKPPPLARVHYEAGDLVTADDTSEAHAAACADLVESLGEITSDGPFTPWVYRTTDGPVRTTLNFPGGVGGPNWGGAAYDVGNGNLIIFSMDVGALGWIVDSADAEARVPYTKVAPRPASFEVRINGTRMPCQRPPWGRLTAVNGSTGKVAWERTLGITEHLPADRQNTGRPGRAAAIVTASGLVFIGSTDDNRFRALEAETGRELWTDDLGRRGHANPMTYGGSDGHQYVAIAATDRLIAYRLP